jgi:hypothetical protein
MGAGDTNRLVRRVANRYFDHFISADDSESASVRCEFRSDRPRANGAALSGGRRTKTSKGGNRGKGYVEVRRALRKIEWAA